jgi:peptidyl-tRNA hydrolase, PTH2 family
MAGQPRRHVKQVIVVRKDLNMPPGKLAAQVAHASLGALLDSGETMLGMGKEPGLIQVPLSGPNGLWLTEEFTKICLMVHSEEELLDLHAKVISLSNFPPIPKSLIKDAGHTFFKEPTYTCLGIGPWWSEELNNFTGHLKLYR